MRRSMQAICVKQLFSIILNSIYQSGIMIQQKIWQKWCLKNRQNNDYEQIDGKRQQRQRLQKNIFSIMLQIEIFQTFCIKIFMLYQSELGVFALTPDQFQLLQRQEPAASFRCSYFEQASEVTSETQVRKVGLLQIRKDFIVVIDRVSGRIRNGFRCAYEVNFEVIRTNPQESEIIGRPISIVFSVRSDQTTELESGVVREQKLQFEIQNDYSNFISFVKVLRKRTIVQRGFYNCFKATRRIGKGSTACVYYAQSLDGSEDVAIKSFKRSAYFARDQNRGRLAFLKEFQILTEISHPNICKMGGVYQTENSTYIILELLQISLSAYIKRFGFFNYDQSMSIAKDLLSAINYLHKKGIMHRDLKLDNIMMRLSEDNNNMNVSIVDFGLAEYTNSSSYLYTRCGTPGYVAPEILKLKNGEGQQNYSQACDIFSLGVVFHLLFLKKALFEGSDAQEVIQKNTQCAIDFTNPIYNSLDNDGKDLLQKMLKKNPTERITAQDAFHHPFFGKVSASTTLNTI